MESVIYTHKLQLRRIMMKKSFGLKLWFSCSSLDYRHVWQGWEPNAMAVAWGEYVALNLPVAVSIRKATYSHAAVNERKAFTVNVPSESYVKEADYFGIYQGKI